jgi:hypothetical protein
MNKFSLDNHPKIASGFTTPSNYFEAFPAAILKEIEMNAPQRKPVYKLKTFAFVAAAVVLVAASIPFITNERIIGLEAVDTDVLENYLSYQSNVSSYDLINLMDYKEIDELQVDLALEDKAIEAILTTNPNFENYIIE